MEERSAHVEDGEETGVYSARKLAELAGATVRTIHYYTAEGLLPPPEGSTRGASYTAAHLARLRIINALRDEGLALGKIRERLAPLTDEQVIHVAEALNEHLAAGSGSPLTPLGLIDLEMTRQNLPDALEEGLSPVALPDQHVAYNIAPPAAPAPSAAQRSGTAREYLDRLLLQKGDDAPFNPPMQRHLQPTSPQQRKPQTLESAEVWYQYHLDDGIELRLREDRFRQTKGRPGALIDAVRSNLRRHGLLADPDNQEDDVSQH